MSDDRYSSQHPSEDEMRRKLHSDWRSVVLWTISIFLGAVLLGFAVRFAHGMDSDEWFKLVVAIEQQQHRLDGDDRKFIRYMINVMTVEDGVIPKPEHQKWLLDIKRRMERER